jgi:hypothetical protein
LISIGSEVRKMPRTARPGRDSREVKKRLMEGRLRSVRSCAS